MKLYFGYLSMLLKQQMQYKTSFFTTVLGQFLVSFTDFLGVYFLLSRFHSVNGFSLSEILICFSVVLMAFATSECFVRGFDVFQRLIRSGELVQALRATEMFDEDLGRHAICRDGFHMGLIYGRYALGCLWAKMLWGITLKDNSFVPAQRMPELEEYFPLGEVDMEAIQLIRNMVDAM